MLEPELYVDPGTNPQHDDGLAEEEVEPEVVVIAEELDEDAVEELGEDKTDEVDELVLGTGELDDIELDNEELLVADEDEEVLDMRAEASHTVGFTAGLPAAYFGKHGP